LDFACARPKKIKLLPGGFLSQQLESCDVIPIFHPTTVIPYCEWNPFFKKAVRLIFIIMLECLATSIRWIDLIFDMDASRRRKEITSSVALVAAPLAELVWAPYRDDQRNET